MKYTTKKIIVRGGSFCCPMYYVGYADLNEQGKVISRKIDNLWEMKEFCTREEAEAELRKGK